MKSIAIANRDSAPHVAAKRLFKGSHLFSEKAGDAYVVYSYGYHYPLLVCYGGQWYENADKSSRSTERQRYYAARSVSTEKKDTKELREMIADAEMAARRQAAQAA